MRRFLASFYRISSRSLFLGIALLLGLFLWHLPQFLNLDTFRPRVTEILESTFHCKVLVGNVTGQLIPAPGLSIGRVVLLEDSEEKRVLASVTFVRLLLSTKALLERRIQFDTIRFIKPRFIAHYTLGSSGEKQWKIVHLPQASPSSDTASIREWEIRNASVEIWDQTAKPTSKWVVDQLSGSFQLQTQTGALAGKATRLGHEAVLDLHYNGAARFPVQAHFNDVELKSLQSLIPVHFLPLKGVSNIVVQSRFQPALEIRAELDQPNGLGKISSTFESRSHGKMDWSVSGEHSVLAGINFQLPEWSAKGDAQGMAAYSRGETTKGGLADVTWVQPAGSNQSALEVNVSSVTIRQILEIFDLQSKPAPDPPQPSLRGYEPWLISQGTLQALIHGTTSFEVRDSDFDLEGMHLNLNGTFDLLKSTPQASIQGSLENIPVAHVIESFFTPASPITGSGSANYALTFPLSADWVKGLNGSVQVQANNGVLKTLKTIYRIISVLNLGNYLRLRFPKITAQGIEFESLIGHLTFQNGVLYSDDLFLKSPNMNVGAKGSVDIPGKQIHSTLRLEMFRFLEDVLRDVPLTHWIFKKPNKIFLPLVVSIDGPWDNAEIH